MKKLITAAILASVLAVPTAFADYGYNPYTGGNIGASSYQTPQQTQEVFTTRGNKRNWGLNVPVFKDRASFFKARDYGIENRGSVICRLERGLKVKFKPYKDWGLGEVSYDGFVDGYPCKGWIDRSVIR